MRVFARVRVSDDIEKQGAETYLSGTRVAPACRVPGVMAGLRCGELL